jgi:hypothetical protein
MTQVSFGGLSFTGGKMFALLTALSTLGGASWGAFQIHADYMKMRNKIEKYSAPDMSGINKRITKLDGTIVLLNTQNEAFAKVVRGQVTSITKTVAELQTDVYDIKLEIKQDISKLSDRIEAQLDKQADNLDAQETRNRDNVGIVRDIINSFEGRIDQKVERLDTKIDDLEKDLDEKITIALSNPLNN